MSGTEVENSYDYDGKLASRGLRKCRGCPSENRSQRKLHGYWAVLRPASNFAVMAVLSSLGPVKTIFPKCLLSHFGTR